MNVVHSQRKAHFKVKQVKVMIRRDGGAKSLMFGPVEVSGVMRK